MKELPLPIYHTLYCLDKAGKIRVFDLNIEPNEDETFDVSSCTGLLGGKLTYQSKKVSSVKRGCTTLLEQAAVVATGIYNDKRNEGYKSEQELLQYAQANDIEFPFDQNLSVADKFRLLKIKHNTDTRWYPLPMLADKYEKNKKKVAFPGFIQPKLNGVRCLALWDRDKDCVVLVSRGGKTYYLPHLERQLKPFFQTNPTIILDGEIFCKGKRLQEISGAARKEKDAPDWLEYHVYDIVSDEPQSARLQDVGTNVFILRTQWGAKNVFAVETRQVTNHDEIKAWHDYFVGEGYEGAMYRNPSAKYGVSFRVIDLLKVKEFLDEEFEIIGCKVDPDKTVGESFVFELKNNTNDLTFFARPTGTVEEKQFWHDNIDAFIGFKATVRYQERTADDLPHQAHVRAADTECLTIEELDPLK
jgi:hypothetical protein